MLYNVIAYSTLPTTRALVNPVSREYSPDIVPPSLAKQKATFQAIRERERKKEREINISIYMYVAILAQVMWSLFYTLWSRG